MKRILSLGLVLITLLSCLCVPSFAANAYSTPLDYSTIDEDFSTIDLDKSSYEGVDSHYFLKLREYGYDTDVYSLYLWFYVPPVSMYESVDYANIQIELYYTFDEKGDPTLYRTFDGRYVQKSGDFYKYKIDLRGFDMEFLFNGGRLYHIKSYRLYPDGSELYQKECAHASNEMNRRYHFIGSDINGNLQCNGLKDEVLDLEVKSTVWRSPTSERLNYQKDVFSVYFSVPNSVVNSYEYLKKMTYRTKEQLWNAVVVNEDRTFTEHPYEKLLPFVGVELGEKFDKTRPTVYAGYTNLGTGSGIAEYSLNGSIFSTTKRYKLCNLYGVEDWEDDDIFIHGNNVTGFFDFTFEDTPSKTDIYEVLFDKTFDLKSFSGPSPTVYKNFIASVLGMGGLDEVDIKNVPPIVQLDTAFFDGYDEINYTEWCNKSLVNYRDMAELRSFYLSAIANNETVYIVRFAVRDYYAADCIVLENDGLELMNENGFYAEGSAFNNFRVISLTYSKDDYDAVILVNSNELDINGGVTPPHDSIGDDIKEKVKDFFGGDDDKDPDILTIIKIILGAIVILFVVLILSKPISLLFQKKKEKK